MTNEERAKTRRDEGWQGLSGDTHSHDGTFHRHEGGDKAHTTHRHPPVVRR